MGCIGEALTCNHFLSSYPLDFAFPEWVVVNHVVLKYDMFYDVSTCDVRENLHSIWQTLCVIHESPPFYQFYQAPTAGPIGHLKPELPRLLGKATRVRHWGVIHQNHLMPRQGVCAYGDEIWLWVKKKTLGAVGTTGFSLFFLFSIGF